MISNAEREELRHAALEVLASRPGTALELAGIRRRIDKDKLVDFAYDNPDLRAALSMLIALEYVMMKHDDLGSTEYFQAEAQGILHYERNP